MTLYKAVTSTDAMSSRTAKMSKPVSAFESRNSAKLRDIKNNAMELGARNKNLDLQNVISLLNKDNHRFLPVLFPHY